MQSGQTKYGIGMTVSACLWLGLFPLMQFGTYSSITRDKWICMLILTGVTVICFLADLLGRRLSRPRLLPLLAGGSLILLMTVSTLFSPYPGASWIGAGRREGLSSQLCYLGVFSLFCFARVRRIPVLAASGTGLCAFLAVVLLQRAGGNPLGLYPESYSYAVSPQFQGTIGNVDMCAGYLLILCGVFFPALIDSFRVILRIVRAGHDPAASSVQPERKTLLLPVLACLSLLFLLGICAWLFVSMQVRFGLLTLAALIILTLIRLLPKKLRLPLLILLMAAVLVFIWFYTGGISTLHELHEIMHGRSRFVYGSGRIGVWTYSFELIREGRYLLTGTGPDTFALRFNEFLTRYFEEHPDAERLKYYYDNPHSEYIALILNCGIPALILFLVLVIGGCLGAASWRSAVLCYGIQALLCFSVCMVAPMFWMILGLSWSAPPPEKGKNA